MTRLEKFCESLTREMLEVAERERETPDLRADPGEAAARLVATRRVREFALEVVASLENPHAHLEANEALAYLDSELTRTDMLFAAHRLKEEGREYFECNDSGCGGRGPTVVDEEGCCVYCGSQARIVKRAAPKEPT